MYHDRLHLINSVRGSKNGHGTGYKAANEIIMSMGIANFPTKVCNKQIQKKRTWKSTETR